MGFKHLYSFVFFFFSRRKVGFKHCILSLLEEGEVFSWGSGSCGKLGQGHLRDRSTPLRVAELKDKKVVKVACHEFHSSAVCGMQF